MYGVGYKNGNPISIGCSSNGKIWSRERCDLQHYQKWCNEIGKIIFDPNIDTNVVLQNMLSYEILKKWPKAYPISMDWNPEMYEHYTQLVHFGESLLPFDEIEITIEEDTCVGNNIIFSLKNDGYNCKYRIDILPNQKDKNHQMKYTKVSGDSITFICANSEIYLEDFLWTAHLPYFMLIIACRTV